MNVHLLLMSVCYELRDCVGEYIREKFWMCVDVDGCNAGQSCSTGQTTYSVSSCIGTYYCVI